MDDQSEPVHVFVRIRPETELEAKVPGASPSRGQWSGSSNSPVIGRSNSTPGYCIIAVDDKTIRLAAPDGIYSTRKSVSAVDDKFYSFDKVFLEDSSQEEIYEFVSEQVLATVRGYNSTIFAYGVTGSGKSYTMTGNKQNPGIIPRAIGDIFRHIDQAAAESDIFFFVRLSYVELYNNSFRNLLEGVSKEMNLNKSTASANVSSFFSEMDDLEAYEAHLGPTFAYARATSAAVMKEYPGQSVKSDKIEVRETQNAGVFLSGPNLRFPVTSAVEAFQLINKGNKMRAVSSTNCNDQSSRSHAILTFHVESRLMGSPLSPDPLSKPEMRIGKIHLVDLAGSERLALSGAEGETLVETKNINSSLTALGDVLSALSKNATVQNNQAKAALRGSVNRSFDGGEKSLPTQFPVPYRNSKLTHLLKDSLGGNSKTVMITNIRKSNEYYQQTMISLMYASRAKKVRNRSTVNRNVIGDSMIHSVNTEIERLKKSLEDRSREFDRLRLVHMKDSKENMALKARLEEMKAANETEKKMLEHQVSQLIVSQAGHVASQKEKIAQLQQALQDELTVSQNRIAEQEQEIKWLKKALDESNQFASHDQVQQLQHSIEVWQEQAKTARHELTVVLGQAEELKALNTTLQGKIKELELSKKQIGEELNERSNECADLTDKLYKITKEKDAIKAEQEAAQHAFEEARAALTDQLQLIRDREVVLEDNSALIDSLRNELATAQERFRIEGNDFRAQTTQMSHKIADLEKEKVDLAAKLNTALRTLEKKSQQMIEDANSKLQERDQRASDAEMSSRRLREELDRLRHDYQELKSIHEGKMAQRDRTLEDMRKHYEQEHRLVTEQAAHVLALEGENESLKDKISKQQLKIKDKAEAHTKTLEDFQAAIGKLEKEVKDAKQAKEDERHSMMAEFEKILQEKRVLHKTELQGLQEQFERTLSSKELDVKLLMEKHERELKEKEIQFQARLRNAETKVRQSIASEVDDGVVKLTEKHRSEIALLKETHAQELQEAHTAMRTMLIKQKEEAIIDLESKLETIHQAKLSAELEIQRQNLLREANDHLQATLTQTKQEYEQKLALLSEAQGDERQRILEEVHKSHDLEKNLALAELERTLIKQHSEVLAAAQERFHQELRDKEMEFHKALSEKSSMEAKKAVALERELLALQFEDEKERALNELRTKLTIEFNASMQSTRQTLLEERARTVQELETQSTSILDEKEATIVQLTSQIKQLSSLHRDELSKALFEQQLGMIEKSNSELESIRAEYAERELKHQAELNALYKANADDLAKQRQELEDAHEQITQALRDELRQARDKIREALEMKASSQNLETALRLEHQKQLDDMLSQKLAEARSSYETALTKMQKQHSEEMLRLRGTIEKLENEYAKQLDEKDAQCAQDIDRIRQQLTDRYNKDVQQLRLKLEEEVEQTRQDLLTRKEEELKKERVELRAQLASKAHDIQELEEKIEALNQAVIDATVKFNREKLEMSDSYKQKQAQQEKDHAEEMDKLRDQQAQVLSEMRTQHMDTLQSLRDELTQKLLKQVVESEQLQRQKDDFFQQEIARLRKELQDTTQLRHEDTSQLEIQMRESLKTIANLNEELHANKLRWMNEKERLRVTQGEEFAAQLQQERQEHDRAMATLKDRYETEIARLQDHCEDTKGSHDSLVLTLRAQLQETKRNNQAELDKLQTSLMRVEDSLEQAEASFKREREQLLARFEREKSALVAQHETMMDFERQEATNLMEKRLTDQKDRFERALKALEDELAQEKEASATKFKNLQEALHMSAKERELLLEEKISQFDETLKEEKEKHTQAIRALEEDFDRRQDDFEESLHQLRVSLQQEKDHSKEMEQEWEQSLDIKESVIQELTLKKTALKDAVSDLQTQVSKMEIALQSKDEELTTLQQTRAQDTDALKASHEKQLMLLHTKHAQEIEGLKEQHVEETRKLKRLLENEIASLKHGLEVASSEAARNIDEVERRYQAELAKKNAELDTKKQMLENLKEENIRAIETVHADLGTQIQEARRTAIRGKEVEIAELRHALEEMESKLSNERVAKDALQRQLRSLERESQNYQQEMEHMRVTHGEDTTRALADLKIQHARALELSKRNEDMKMQQLLEDHREEVAALKARIDQLEHRGRDHEKLYTEKSSLVENLEKDNAKLKEMLQKSEQDASQRIQQLQQNQEAAVRALQEQLAQLDHEKQAFLNEIRQHEADRARMEANFLRKLEDKDNNHADEMEHALEEQKKDLQEEYLNSIRQQIDLVVSMIQAQSGGGKASGKYLQELQSRFMDLIQDLPDLWKQRHGVSIQEKMQSLQVANNGANALRHNAPRTPIHILADASIDFDTGDKPYFDAAKRNTTNNTNSNTVGNNPAKTGGTLGNKDNANAPWSSPSLRASPTDQLIAAILDGDVQGIRAVVRSKGEDLKSEFWSDLAKSVLPIHRAISGLHFHGSEKLLIATIEVLVQLGAEINAVDHAGNGVLHKAIQVCTSKSAAAVVQCLLNRGADPRLVNKEGDTALHAECRRVRTASVEVIEALLASGADPNVKNPHNLQLTPLTLVLLRGASTTPTGMSVIYPLGKSNAVGSASDPLLLPNGSPNAGNPGLKYQEDENMQLTTQQLSQQQQPKSSSRKTWLKAAELLVKSGAYWDASWRSPHGCTQLHLLLASFPPSRDDTAIFRALLKSALDAGVNPAHEDQKGRNALFVLCEQMAVTPSDQAPDAPRLIHILIEASSVMTPQQQQYGIGGSDRTGRTIFDIQDGVPHSCLHACKSLLVQATSKAAALSAASGYRGSNNHNNTNASANNYTSSSSGPSAGAGNDWEKERLSKVSSAMLVQLTQHNPSSTTGLLPLSTANAGNVGMRSRSASYHNNSTAHNSRATSPRYGNVVRGYFDQDDDAEEEEDPRLRFMNRSHFQGAGNNSSSANHSRRPSASSATGGDPPQQSVSRRPSTAGNSSRW